MKEEMSRLYDIRERVREARQIHQQTAGALSKTHSCPTYHREAWRVCIKYDLGSMIALLPRDTSAFFFLSRVQTTMPKSTRMILYMSESPATASFWRFHGFYEKTVQYNTLDGKEEKNSFPNTSHHLLVMVALTLHFSRWLMCSIASTFVASTESSPVPCLQPQPNSILIEFRTQRILYPILVASVPCHRETLSIQEFCLQKHPSMQ